MFFLVQKECDSFRVKSCQTRFYRGTDPVGQNWRGRGFADYVMHGNVTASGPIEHG